MNIHVFQIYLNLMLSNGAAAGITLILCLLWTTQNCSVSFYNSEYKQKKKGQKSEALNDGKLSDPY